MFQLLFIKAQWESREHEDKSKVIVYDYLDNMKVLEKMYFRRIKGYKIAGYEIIEEV